MWKNQGRWHLHPKIHVLQPTLNPPIKLLFCSQGLGVQLINFLTEFLSRLRSFEFESIRTLVRTSKEG